MEAVGLRYFGRAREVGWYYPYIYIYYIGEKWNGYRVNLRERLGVQDTENWA